MGNMTGFDKLKNYNDERYVELITLDRLRTNVDAAMSSLASVARNRGTKEAINLAVQMRNYLNGAVYVLDDLITEEVD